MNNTIYIIRCKITEKLYIGQTWNDLHDRLIGHKSAARNQHNVCIKLERAINKYGEANFSIEKLDEAYSQGEANTLEDFYILAGDTITNGYNIRRGGSHGKLSAETRAKISKANSGAKNYWFGKPMPEWKRQQLLVACIGRAHTKEHRKKHSQTLQPLNNDIEKYCPKCKLVKLHNDFYKKKSGTVNSFYILNNICISCESQRNKEKYLRSKLPPK